MSSGIDLQASFIEILQGFGLTPGVAKAVWIPLPMVLIVGAVTVMALVSTWLERKVSAAAQQRIGPEYMGPLGLLVPVADVAKLLFKENMTPARTDPLLFSLAPLLVFIPVFLSFLIVPFGQNLVITDLNIGIFLWISLSSISSRSCRVERSANSGMLR